MYKNNIGNLYAAGIQVPLRAMTNLVNRDGRSHDFFALLHVLRVSSAFVKL